MRLAATALVACSLAVFATVPRAHDVAASTHAQTTASALLREVMHANATWADAIRRQDEALLLRMMAPDYRLSYESTGKSVGLDTWMRNFRRMKMQAYRPRITHVRLLGPDTVAASVASNWEATLANGKSLSEEFTAIDTWVRRDGRWVVVGRRVMALQLVEAPVAGRPATAD